MKKKIALISFVDSENYGAILQAVALQNKLNRLGFEGTYINYSRKSGLKGVKKIINRLWGIARLMFGYKARLDRTNVFKDKHLSLTKIINDNKDLLKLPPFDFYIVGSDQVWHPKWLTLGSGFFLLSFITDDFKKISYASSFGTLNIPDNAKSIYHSELSKFKYLSVREEQGAEFLRSINLQSSVVLDPTLLLEKDNWLEFFNIDRIVKEPYILCYVMPGDHKGASFIKKVSAQINITNSQKSKVIVVGDKEYKKLIPGYNLVSNAGPSEFLNLIYNASYVVTNSFHGTCFALNFEKEFTTVLHRENPLNIRINDLLQRVSLTNRVLYTDKNVTEVKLLKINYKNVNKKLSLLRNSSKSFLIDALEKNNN